MGMGSFHVFMGCFCGLCIGRPMLTYGCGCTPIARFQTLIIRLMWALDDLGASDDILHWMVSVAPICKNISKSHPSRKPPKNMRISMVFQWDANSWWGFSWVHLGSLS